MKSQRPKFNEQGYYEMYTSKNCTQRVFIVKRNCRDVASVRLYGIETKVPEKFLGKRVSIKLEVLDEDMPQEDGIVE